MTDEKDTRLDLAEILGDVSAADATEIMEVRANALARRYFTQALAEFGFIDPGHPEAQDYLSLANYQIASAFIAEAVRKIAEPGRDGDGREAAAFILEQHLDELGFGLPVQAPGGPKPYKLEKQRQKAARKANRRRL